MKSVLAAQRFARFGAWQLRHCAVEARTGWSLQHLTHEGFHLGEFRFGSFVNEREGLA